MESELWPHLDDLEDGVEKLSSVLKPLMEENMAKNASQLPLLDKAKLYILTTYTIESLIFSYLELSGVSTTDHPIMKELTRVRQYFQKIRDIENKQPAPGVAAAANADAKHKDTRDNLVLDKPAAERFINAALAGNDKYDAERAENVRVQKEKALEKFKALGEGKKNPIGRRAVNESSDEEDGGVKLVSGETDDQDEDTKGSASKATSSAASAVDDDDEDEDSNKKRRKEKKKRKREQEAALGQPDTTERSKKPKKDKKDKKKEKKQKKDKSKK